MIKNDKHIDQLMRGNIIEHIATIRDVSETQAREILANMSFMEHMKIMEAVNIIPPSGQSVGQPIQPQKPTQNTQPNQPATPPQPTSRPPANNWGGGTNPIKQGMSVSMTGDDGKSINGEVTQVDTPSNGVKVRNPVTGKIEWRNTGDLQPIQAQQTAESVEIKRLKQLAGISEECSAGATGAGSIAVSPTSPAPTRKRTEEAALQKEYTRKKPAETIIGDTKPGQASGELSANLAATPGKKTASRPGNGVR